MNTRSSLTALGVALALAVTFTTAIVPAFAEAPKLEQAKPPSIVDVLGTKPKFEQDKPPSIVDVLDTKPQPKDPGNQGSGADMTFKSDVLVSFQSQSSSGASTLYRFKVQNIGIETAHNVALGNSVSERQNNGTLGKFYQGSSGTIASLASGQFEEITVTCSPSAGYHCYSAGLDASVNNDLNPNNNSAHS